MHLRYKAVWTRLSSPPTKCTAAPSTHLLLLLMAPGVPWIPPPPSAPCPTTISYLLPPHCSLVSVLTPLQIFFSLVFSSSLSPPPRTPSCPPPCGLPPKAECPPPLALSHGNLSWPEPAQASGWPHPASIHGTWWPRTHLVAMPTM